MDQLAAAGARRERSDQHLQLPVDHDRQMSARALDRLALAAGREVLGELLGVDARRPRLVHRHPDGSHLRVGERRLGHRSQVGRGRATGRRPGRHQPLVVREVRELQPAGRVSRDEQAVGGPELLVDDGHPSFVQRGPCLLGPELPQVGSPAPHGQQQLRPLDGAAVGQVHDAPETTGRHRFGAPPIPDVDPLLGQLVRDRLRRQRVVARQDAVARLDDRDGNVEPRVHLRELHADGPAAEHHQAGGELAGRGRLPIGPVAGLRQARQRGHDRRRARRDDDVARLERLGPAVVDRDLDAPRSREAAVPLDHASARCLQVPDVAGVARIRRSLAGDHPVPAVRGMLPGHVEAAVAPGSLVQQRLRGHAGPEGTLAAHQVALDHRHCGPPRSCLERRRLAGRASSDHDHVVHVTPRLVGPGGVYPGTAIHDRLRPRWTATTRWRWPTGGDGSPRSIRPRATRPRMIPRPRGRSGAGRGTSCSPRTRSHPSRS